MHARVTAHRGWFILECLAEKSIPGECHLSIDNAGVLGQVFMDSEKFVGMSPEAIELMKTVQRGSGSLGDLDWWSCNDGKFAFGWLGGINAIKPADEIETSRQFTIGKFIEIPNESVPEAIEAIDSCIASMEVPNQIAGG